MSAQLSGVPSFTRAELTDLATHYQEAAAKAGSTAMRMRLALLILRHFALGGDWDPGVVTDIRTWIDSGMDNPIPWPSSHFFQKWAHRQGIENVDGCVGFRATMALPDVGTRP